MIAGDHAPNFPLKHAQKVSAANILVFQMIDSQRVSTRHDTVFMYMSLSVCNKFWHTCFNKAILHEVIYSASDYCTDSVVMYMCADVAYNCS